MRHAVIDLKNVTKTFELHKGKGTSLKAAVLSFRRSRPQNFQALKGIDLSVGSGENVALIGRNGSGKSTLLSIIGKVYLPTSGSVQVAGRMSTILDPGAGFHPELTGRENIYFNGAVLGLSNAEIKERIDPIIDFSEISDFIDAPVKTYSEGMLLRLGFSIAVESNPDILLIDEALAVGDAEFQEKCYNRIMQFQASGKTILFSTHDLEAAKNVASRAVWLHLGELKADGETNEVIEQYLSTTKHN